MNERDTQKQKKLVVFSLDHFHCTEQKKKRRTKRKKFSNQTVKVNWSPT